MNYHQYCRKNNGVTFANFMADLNRCDVLFIAETDHFSLVQESNERRILERIISDQKAAIAVEDISDKRYDPKRNMLSRYSNNGLLYLTPDNQEMLNQVLSLIKKERKTVIIAGSRHLAGPLSIDVLVRYQNKSIDVAAVILDETVPTPGIYRKQTALGRDFIVVGDLR